MRAFDTEITEDASLVERMKRFRPLYSKSQITLTAEHKHDRDSKLVNSQLNTQKSNRRRKLYRLTSFVLCTAGICFLTQNIPEQSSESFAASSIPMSTTLSLPPQSPSPSRLPIHIDTLNTDLLPGHCSSADVYAADRRLIFIGDVHGCMSDLSNLLEKVKYDDRYDHIVMTGDIINKGPASHDVLDFLISRRASCVRGNHDQTILNLRGDIGSDPSIPIGKAGNAETQLAQSLTTSQLSYLASCPIILRIGDIGSSHYVVVHGGLVPSLKLEQQSPWAAMHVRILDTTTHEPFEQYKRTGSVHWAELWNDYQAHPAYMDGESGLRCRPAGSKPTTVIYGHDARRGLQIKPYSKGLDTGCVKGEQLTALVVTGTDEQQLHQVSCDQNRR